MSYEEKRIYKAAARVGFIENGFKKSVLSAAESLSKCSIDEVPTILETLSLEYEALKEAREDLEYAKKLHAQALEV